MRASQVAMMGREFREPQQQQPPRGSWVRRLWRRKSLKDSRSTKDESAALKHSASPSVSSLGAGNAEEDNGVEVLLPKKQPAKAKKEGNEGDDGASSETVVFSDNTTTVPPPSPADGGSAVSLSSAPAPTPDPSPSSPSHAAVRFSSASVMSPTALLAGARDTPSPNTTTGPTAADDDDEEEEEEDDNDEDEDEDEEDSDFNDEEDTSVVSLSSPSASTSTDGQWGVSSAGEDDDVQHPQRVVNLESGKTLGGVSISQLTRWQCCQCGCKTHYENPVCSKLDCMHRRCEEGCEMHVSA